MGLLFSFAGRIGRGRFWLGTILGLVITMAIIGAGAALVPWSEVIIKGADGQAITNPDGSYQLDWSNAKLLPGYIAYGLSLLLGIWIGLAVNIKRLHDRGKAGWWVLLMLIPFAGFIWWLVDLGILEGQPGLNKYGDNPLTPKSA